MLQPGIDPVPSSFVSRCTRIKKLAFDAKKEERRNKAALTLRARAVDVKPTPTLERAMGIEPTYPAWKAGVLPLNYARGSKFSLRIITLLRALVNIFMRNLVVLSAFSENYDGDAVITAL